MAAILAFIQEFSYYAVFARPDLILVGATAAWVWSWIWVPGTALIVFIPLLFPDGKLPSPRWRALVWLAVSNSILMTITVAFTPGPLGTIALIDNPVGIENTPQFFEMFSIITGIGYAGSILLATMSLLQRYQRARGSERQQIKWFVYAVVLFVLTSPTSQLGFPWLLVAVVTFVFIPVTAVIAIFRYRLYDIDIIIRRTLIYSSLTAAVALVYFGSVVLLQGLVGAFLSLGTPIVTVLSTLATAALFSPLRRRIQEAIDRRFYRRKYDAQRTFAVFSVQMRDEVELEKLSEALLAVVEETMQPEQVSLWLREGD
jgi:uncharacterized membrane protein